MNLLNESSDSRFATREWNILNDQWNVNYNFKYFNYKAKLLGNPEANKAHGILRNAAIALPLKYLSNFW